MKDYRVYNKFLDMEDTPENIGDVPIYLLNDFVSLFFIKTQNINRKHSAYGLKHIVEGFFNSYVTEAGLIKSMLEVGFDMDDYSFNISEKSPALQLRSDSRAVCKLYFDYFKEKEGSNVK